MTSPPAPFPHHSQLDLVSHTKPVRTRRSSRSSSPTSTATSIDDIHDIDRINAFRPMYDSTSPLAERLGEMRVADHNYAKVGEAKKSEEGQVVSEKKRFPEEDDEEMLRETNDRFVLFPIKYHEVGHGSIPPRSKLTSDLGRIQSLAGVILDSRGDRPRARSAPLARAFDSFRTVLHSPHSRLFRRFRRYRRGEHRLAVFNGRSMCRSAGVLRFSDDDRTGACGDV